MEVPITKTSKVLVLEVVVEPKNEEEQQIYYQTLHNEDLKEEGNLLFMMTMSFIYKS